MGLLSPRGSHITTTTVAGTGYAMIMTRERCLLVLEFFFCFVDQGLGSRSAAWASRMDVIWVSVYVSSVVGCCSYVLWCCIRVALYASCMYPLYYVMLMEWYPPCKSVSICGSILGGAFEFRLNRVAYWAWQVGIRASTDPRSPLDCWPLLSLEENCFQSLVISEGKNSFDSSAPSSLW